MRDENELVTKMDWTERDTKRGFLTVELAPREATSVRLGSYRESESAPQFDLIVEPANLADMVANSLDTMRLDGKPARYEMYYQLHNYSSSSCEVNISRRSAKVGK